MESQGTVFFVFNTPPNTTGEAYMATLRDTLKGKEINFINKLQKKMDNLYPPQDIEDDFKEEQNQPMNLESDEEEKKHQKKTNDINMDA